MHAAPPMWRNGRRNGLKIEVLAVSVLCVAYQISPSLPKQIAQFANFSCLSEREQKRAHSCTNSCTPRVRWRSPFCLDSRSL